MKSRSVQFSFLALIAVLLGGCAATPHEVEAVAPAPQDNLVGVAPVGGQYSLYRAEGFDNSSEPVVEKLWTVYVPEHNRLGFRWITDRAQQWAPTGALHLQAFADGNQRDLGAFNNRDVKYVWAASNADVVGYFHHEATRQGVSSLLLQ